VAGALARRFEEDIGIHGVWTREPAPSGRAIPRFHLAFRKPIERDRTRERLDSIERKRRVAEEIDPGDPPVDGAIHQLKIEIGREAIGEHGVWAGVADLREQSLGDFGPLCPWSFWGRLCGSSPPEVDIAREHDVRRRGTQAIIEMSTPEAHIPRVRSMAIWNEREDAGKRLHGARRRDWQTDRSTSIKGRRRRPRRRTPSITGDPPWASTHDVRGAWRERRSRDTAVAAIVLASCAAASLATLCRKSDLSP
jgi:hypothetical protein